MTRRSRRVRASLLLTLLVAFALGVAGPVQAGGSKVVYSGPTNHPWIAITFDDGWGVANCRRIVNILEATHTAATFLPTAAHVKEAPGFWRSVAQKGFPIGNHTVHHRILRGVPAWRQDLEIGDARRIIEGITGVTMAPVFRPPTGAFDATTRSMAAKNGLTRIVLWDTTFADTSHPRGGGWWSDSTYYRSAVRGGRGSIILAHCGADPTVHILARVIAHYRSHGLTFVTLPKLLGLPTGG